jgi:hypothetical protein
MLSNAMQPSPGGQGSADAQPFALRLCADNAEWDALLAGSSQRNAFCCSDFLSVMPHRPALWLLERKNIPVAGAIVFADGRLSLPAPQALTCYQGMFLLPPRGESHSRTRWQLETLSMLLEGLSGQYDSLSFSLHPSLSDVRAFQWFNYHGPSRNRFAIDVAYTGIVDLAPFDTFESYLGDIRSARRQDAKKSINARIEAIESDDVDAFDRLHDATFARQGVVRSSEEREFIRSALGALLRSGRCRMLMGVPPGGEPVAAAVFLHDRATAYYYFGACDPNWRNSGVSTFLILESIRHAWTAGVRTVDMVGMNSPQRGDFKASFNAEPRVYFNVHWTRQ